MDDKAKPKPPVKSKLKFKRDDEKDKRQLDKSIRRVEKTGLKLDNARETLAEQKPYKPPGVMKTLARAAAFEVRAKIHGKIHEAENENSAVEAAHKTELYGERAAGSAVRFVKNRNRTRPARRVRALEKQNVRASADSRFRQMAKENPELKKDALKKYRHKKRIEKQFRKQSSEAAKKSAKTGKKVGVMIGRTFKFAGRLIASNPKVFLAILAILLLIFIISACVSMTVTVFNGLGGAAVGGVSYLAEPEDIDEAEIRYTEWEADIYLQALNAETSHAGYDEYIFSLDTPGHDPFALIAYLTAKYDAFNYSAVQAELQNIFNQQYTLTFTPSMEIRYRTETVWDYYIYEDIVYWYSYEVEVPYEWHILTVTLTALSFEDIINPRLTTQEQQERYAVYLLTKGNRQYFRNPLGISDWLYYVSSGYGYRINPATGEKEYHTGVDLTIPANTPIMAGGMGTVIETGNNAEYGQYIIIDYGGGITARYACLSAIYITTGQVQAGDIIALSGDTVLHIEIIKDGRYISPFFFME